jgi:hypothetical protein
MVRARINVLSWWTLTQLKVLAFLWSSLHTSQKHRLLFHYAPGPRKHRPVSHLGFSVGSVLDIFYDLVAFGALQDWVKDRFF